MRLGLTSNPLPRNSGTNVYGIPAVAIIQSTEPPELASGTYNHDQGQQCAGFGEWSLYYEFAIFTANIPYKWINIKMYYVPKHYVRSWLLTKYFTAVATVPSCIISAFYG